MLSLVIMLAVLLVICTYVLYHHMQLLKSEKESRQNDINILKKQEAQLRDTLVELQGQEHHEKLLERIVQATMIGILLVDQEGFIRMSNPEAEDILGYTGEELTSLKVEQLVPPDLRHQHVHDRNSFFQHPSCRKMGVGRDIVALRKNGDVVPVEIGLGSAGSDYGQMVIVTLVDISAKSKLKKLWP